jgi:hypothetical protein
MTIIAVTKVMELLMTLVKYHKVFGDEEEEEMSEGAKRMFS